MTPYEAGVPLMFGGGGECRLPKGGAGGREERESRSCWWGCVGLTDRGMRVRVPCGRWKDGREWTVDRGDGG